MQIFKADRGGWWEYYVSGNIPEDNFKLEADEPELLELLKTSDTARIRLYGNCDIVLTEFEQSLYGKRHSVDCFINPKIMETKTVGVFGFFVRLKAEGSIRGYDFKSGENAWVVESPDARMGFVSRVAASGNAGVEAYGKTYNDTVNYICKMGFEPADITRTWCCFSDVLDQYGAFNQVRREIFRKSGISHDKLPASTGVQSILKSGEPLMMDTLAFSGSSLKIRPFSNPGQCDPIEYSVLFSRAVCVEGAGAKQWIVSGMASISEDGKSIFQGDLGAQIRTTIGKAEIMLNAFGLNWKNVCAGIAYLHPEHFSNARRIVSDSVLQERDFAIAAGCICRHDLLFEIEFMAFGD